MLDNELISVYAYTHDSLVANINPDSPVEVSEKCPLAVQDSFEELVDWASRRNLTWRVLPNQIFGGYWVNQKNGVAYIPV